jgi:lipoyl(octanoyl) transferase
MHAQKKEEEAIDARQHDRGTVIDCIDGELSCEVMKPYQITGLIREHRKDCRGPRIIRVMINYVYLGRVGYEEALRLQEELVELRRANRIGNVLLLLEHPPVLTLGRHANRANVLASDELLAARGVTLHQISRGGDVTFHGPGQLVGYPIFDLRSLERPSGGRMGPVDFVRLMEEALIGVCGAYGVRAGRVAGLTGVWIGAEEQHARKIGAIGIHVSRGITSHGFAFNVTTELRDFQLINPCGITDKPVTSLERELADPATLPQLEAIAHEAARQFGIAFGQELIELQSVDQLRQLAAKTESQSAVEFPAGRHAGAGSRGSESPAGRRGAAGTRVSN